MTKKGRFLAATSEWCQGRGFYVAIWSVQGEKAQSFWKGCKWCAHIPFQGFHPRTKVRAYYKDSLRKRSTASLTEASSRRRRQDYSLIKNERGLWLKWIVERLSLGLGWLKTCEGEKSVCGRSALDPSEGRRRDVAIRFHEEDSVLSDGFLNRAQKQHLTPWKRQCWVHPFS